MNWVSDDEFETARLTVENCVWSIAAAQEAVDADPRVAEWFSRYIKGKQERELELSLMEEQELVQESEPERDPELEQELDIDPPDFELFRGF